MDYIVLSKIKNRITIEPSREGIVMDEDEAMQVARALMDIATTEKGISEMKLKVEEKDKQYVIK